VWQLGGGGQAACPAFLASLATHLHQLPALASLSLPPLLTTAPAATHACPPAGFLEHSVQRTYRASIKQHLLLSYNQSFAAILRGQHEGKGLRCGGVWGAGLGWAGLGWAVRSCRVVSAPSPAAQGL
jgi:hypothetical protein